MVLAVLWAALDQGCCCSLGWSLGSGLEEEDRRAVWAVDREELQEPAINGGSVCNGPKSTCARRTEAAMNCFGMLLRQRFARRGTIWPSSPGSWGLEHCCVDLETFEPCHRAA